MCGRFYYDGDFSYKLNEILEKEEMTTEYRALDIREGDIFPSDKALVIHDGPSLTASFMTWGFKNPYNKGLLINARSETADEKKLFSESIRNRRCVIPASGFYEWDRYKARFRFRAPDESLIFLAGFYHHEPESSRYTILTCDANRSMIKVHDRMPVMLSRSEIKSWIRDEDYHKYLKRPQMELASVQDQGQIRMTL